MIIQESPRPLDFRESETKPATDTNLSALTQKIWQEIQAGSLVKSKIEWNKTCWAMDAAELKQLLDTVAQNIAGLEHPIGAMDQLAKIIPLKQLQNAIRTQYPSHVDALQTAQEMFLEAKHYLRTTEEGQTSSFQVKISALIDSLILGLESILSAFGIGDFFQPAANMIEAEIKSQKIMMLLSLFSTLSALLVPSIGAAAVGMIVGGTLLSIAALSLLFPLIRPAPSYLPKAVNWTKQFQEGHLRVAEGRKKTFDEMAFALTTGKGIKTHPLLIGKSGAGKTETAKAFVQAIERGDYPELKEKRVFYFNTPDLVKGAEMLTGENKILSQIKEAIGRHREKIILIFDEIHLACQKSQSVFGDQLKTLLDPGLGGFPYVIGITTEEEFFRDISVTNAAFARRFRRISLDNPAESETLAILHNTALQQAPKIILKTGALNYLLKRTRTAFPHAPEPLASLKILGKCIQKTAESQKSPTDKKVEHLQKELHSILLQNAAGQGTAFLPYASSEGIHRLKEELMLLEQDQNKEKAEIDRFYQMRDHLSEVKKTVFQTVLKLGPAATASLNLSEKTKNKFLLLSHFLAPAQVRQVQEEADRLGIKTVIDPGLIDQAIQEELEQERKAAQAVERGKNQIRDRTQR